MSNTGSRTRATYYFVGAFCLLAFAAGGYTINSMIGEIAQLDLRIGLLQSERSAARNDAIVASLNAKEAAAEHGVRYAALKKTLEGVQAQLNDKTVAHRVLDEQHKQLLADFDAANATRIQAEADRAMLIAERDAANEKARVAATERDAANEQARVAATERDEANEKARVAATERDVAHEQARAAASERDAALARVDALRMETLSQLALQRDAALKASLEAHAAHSTAELVIQKLSKISFTENCMGICVGCTSGVVRHTASEILKLVAPFTMLSPERLQANKAAVAYVVKRGLRGDILEAGVAAGGSAAMLGLTAAALGSPRRLHLYDTFAGLPPANASFDGDVAMEYTGRIAFGIEKVRDYLVGTGLPSDSLVFHPGDVKNTLNPALKDSKPPPPCTISILRLDTDWYESHVVLLHALYPLVVPGGVIISDDYGFWPGAKRAVDEWLAMPGHGAPVITIDNSGVMWCKPGGAQPCDLDNWKSVA